jgi:NDP-sugar pyrophosphorylase family protein
MKIIIPMAGSGNRFLEKGYVLPKPLIFVNGKRILEYILESYSNEDEIIFICNQEHLEKTEMRSILLSLRSNARIISIPQHKLGPVHTVRMAYEYIDDEEEIIISYCDNPFIWNYTDFKEYIKKNYLDGCIVTHTGFHPHSLNSTKMAFLKTQERCVLEIKEKECYTSNHLEEHASTGSYYFKKGKYIKKFFDELISQNIIEIINN